MKKALLLLSLLSIGSISAVRVTNDTPGTTQLRYKSTRDQQQWTFCSLLPGETFHLYVSNLSVRQNSQRNGAQRWNGIPRALWTGEIKLAGLDLTGEATRGFEIRMKKQHERDKVSENMSTNPDLASWKKSIEYKNRDSVLMDEALFPDSNEYNQR